MSYMKDPDVMVRGVRAIASLDAKSPRRAALRARRAKLERLRDQRVMALGASGSVKATGVLLKSTPGFYAQPSKMPGTAKAVAPKGSAWSEFWIPGTRTGAGIRQGGGAGEMAPIGPAGGSVGPIGPGTGPGTGPLPPPPPGTVRVPPKVIAPSSTASSTAKPSVTTTTTGAGFVVVPPAPPTFTPTPAIDEIPASASASSSASSSSSPGDRTKKLLLLGGGIALLFLVFRDD